jgi:signal transduction histidine kinase
MTQQPVFNFNEKIIPGAAVQFFLAAIVAVFVPMGQEDPWVFWTSLGVIALSSALRILCACCKKSGQGYIGTLTLCSGLAWGLLTGYEIAAHGINRESLLLVMMTLGNGAAALTSLFYDLRLTRYYVGALLLPQFAVNLWIGASEGRSDNIAYALMSALFFIFLWRESKVSNRLYWQNVKMREDAVARQRELERTRNVAMGTARMAALGEMASGVAHEINNPLTVIRGTMAVLQDQIQNNNLDAEKLMLATERVQRTLDRIAKIVRGLLGFARENSYEALESRPLLKVLEETHDLCRDRMKRLQIDFKIEGDLPRFQIMDRGTQLSQVLLNLLNNSIDAIKELPEPWIHLQVQNKNSFVEISITDSGPGIPAETVEKIFQPFYTTKPVGEGTGLGLSISKGLIENLGGEITYDANSPHTRFILRLPLA